MRNKDEVMSSTRWEPQAQRNRRTDRARRSRGFELSTRSAVKALGALLAAAFLAACLPKMHRVPDTERCANGVVSACTPDICATYAPDEVPAGCLDADAWGTDTSDAGSTDTSSAPDNVGEDTAGPDTAPDTTGEDTAGPDTAPDAVTDTVADTASDTVADTVTDTVADTVPDTGVVADTGTGADTGTDTAPDTLTDTAPDTLTDTAPDTGGEDTAAPDTGPCDPPTEGCPCSYQGKAEGVCAAATFDASAVCQKPIGFQGAEVSCDGLDNDCDGVTDEGCPCDYQGDPDGVCLAGGVVDGTDGSCSGVPSSYESSEQTCDGLDNDCDGSTDEGLTGPPTTKQAGVCSGAKKICDGAGGWADDYSSLTGYEATEQTCDGLDNDCDGSTDEGLTGPPTTKQDGVCSGAKKSCGGASGWVDDYSSLTGYESTEQTCDGLDNDCDGVMDEGCGCDYQGKPDGVCGTATISATNGACAQPQAYEGSTNTEAGCGDGLDNDCDGVTDEGCACDYQGKPDGVCATATRSASGVCQKPTGFQASETTCDDLDNDCDGVVDEGCPCHFQGLDQGVCSTSFFTADGVCAVPSGYQATEASCDGLDNDCDGVMDEGCAQGAFVQVPAGTFMMGSPTGEPGRESGEDQHQVTLTRSFYLQETEVTQGQWEALMGNNPSHYASCGAGCPVEMVSWWEALAYANAVSADQGLPACYSLQGCTGTAGGGQADGMTCTGVTVNAPGGNPYLCTGYRLPTEAEWEYAYRAGTTTAFYNGDITNTGLYGIDANLDVIGWYYGNAGGKTHPAAQKVANAWGLFDMAGNVFEGTSDWYGSYPTGAVSDPTGPDAGPYRVDRGGSWNNTAGFARAAYRIFHDPDERDDRFGFRLARTAP